MCAKLIAMTAPYRRRVKPGPPLVSIRAVREAYGITIPGLITRIAEHGHQVNDTSTIRNVETGNQRPSRPLMTAWARALQLNPADVILPASDDSNEDAAA